jgi:hypothetical protein
LDAEVMAVDNFNIAINRFVQKVVPDKIVSFQKKIIFQALQKLIEKTPVDEGPARANWQVTIGTPATSILDAEDKEGGATFEKGAAVTAALGPFQNVWITNNSQYIEVLENGGFIPKSPGPSKDKRPDRKGKVLVVSGYSAQAPNGMLKVTFEEIKAQFV